MKRAIIILIVLMFCGCNDYAYPFFKDDYTLTTTIIEGCEYFQNGKVYTNNYSLCHKGNCKNPIHSTVIHDTIYVIEKTKKVIESHE